jgi:hypothetical protein
MCESHVPRTNPSAARASASGVLDLGLRVGRGIRIAREKKHADMEQGQHGVSLDDVSCCCLLIAWICLLAGWMQSR